MYWLRQSMPKSKVDYCFLVLAHHRPESLFRFLNEIRQSFDGFISVAIHIDRKTEQEQFHKLSELQNCDIHFVQKRVFGKWGDISLVVAALELFRYANSFWNFHHAILVSGEDSLVCPSTLARLNVDCSMLAFWKLPHEGWWGGGMFRVDRLHLFNKKSKRWLNNTIHQYFGFFFRRKSAVIMLKEHFPKWHFYGGQQWMVLNAEAVDYLIRFVDDHPQIWAVFRHSFAPDELFIQTILCNNKSLKILNKPTHYVRFKGFGSSPEYLSTEELAELKNNREFLFARKYAG